MIGKNDAAFTGEYNQIARQSAGRRNEDELCTAAWYKIICGNVSLPII